MQNYEKLGAFYLGKLYDEAAREPRDELLLYDSKDLTTHAVCVGMTGSGKTGLCLSLLEEAAIDGVPAIAIDPKGDLGNLLLTFPELRPEDFRPWIDQSEAARAGTSADQFAAETAKRWREGLASWGQEPERIARFRDAVDLAIYTPGSSAGLPLTVLRSFRAPPAAIVEDADAFRERVVAATAGLLALVGVDADPIRSREQILVASILDRVWRAGRDLDIAGLIHAIQAPPFDKVGLVDLESFFPVEGRMELSMRLNNLLASPSFGSWLEGESLDVKRLLHTPEGKPRLSILSIAHLSEAERMFFVTILLGEVLAWVRSQPGTSSLRAILYMDEVFGYFPPTANPPSKSPMLTLLKQARAYGLGVVLATQNPVDLDYKGLSNAGTWFLGRLQTERDKARVLEGLEGASREAGAAFDRQRMETTLAGLSSRVFLMNNVHEDQPVLFQTRWALSYLRGPLTRMQIQKLMAERKKAVDETLAAAAVSQRKPRVADAATAKIPAIPPGIDVVYLARSERIGEGRRLVYRPALLGRGRLHFVRATYKLDVWRDRVLLAQGDASLENGPWDEAERLDPHDLQMNEVPEASAEFAPLPAPLIRPDNYTNWARDLKDFLYQSQVAVVWKCPALKEYSEAGESEGDFRIRLAQLAREARDLEVEKLRKRYASKLAAIQGRIRTAEERIARETSQFRQATFQSAVSFGASILGALFGRKLASRTNVSKAATSIRSASRAAGQRDDISRAEEKLDALKEDLAQLEADFDAKIENVEAAYHADALELEPLEIRPRKSDIAVDSVALAWTPWCVDGAGIAESAY